MGKAARVAQPLRRRRDAPPAVTQASTCTGVELRRSPRRSAAILVALMQTGVQLLREIVEALNRGDVEGMLERMHPEFEWRPLGP